MPLKQLLYNIMSSYLSLCNVYKSPPMTLLCKNHVAIIHTVDVSKPSDVMSVWYSPHGGGYQVEMIKNDRNNPFLPNNRIERVIKELQDIYY